jgi:hypothetical protein
MSCSTQGCAWKGYPNSCALPACCLVIQRCWVMAAQRGYELPQPPAPRYYHQPMPGVCGGVAKHPSAAHALRGLKSALSSIDLLKLH